MERSQHYSRYNIYFSNPVPNYADMSEIEGKMVSKLFEENVLQFGTTWYVIEMEWWNRWKRYAHDPITKELVGWSYPVKTSTEDQSKNRHPPGLQRLVPL